jgi:hypothetical protein
MYKYKNNNTTKNKHACFLISKAETVDLTSGLWLR